MLNFLGLELIYVVHIITYVTDYSKEIDNFKTELRITLIAYSFSRGSSFYTLIFLNLYTHNYPVICSKSSSLLDNIAT